MIHRFVDLVSVPVPWSTIWNVQRQISGTTRQFAIDTKGVSTIAVYLGLSATGAGPPGLNLPELSPDLMSYAYIIVPAAGTRGQVRVGDTNEINATVLVGQNPTGGPATPPQGGTQIVGWSPDSQHVYWRGTNNNTDDDSEIWRVEPDGTNATLIWTDTVIINGAWGQLPRISPDGTQIAWWTDADAPTAEGLWVMDSDGTNDTRIVSLSNSGGDFYGWSRDSEWLLFFYTDVSAFPTITRYIKKVRPDGSDLTTVYATTGTDIPSLSYGQNSIWLPDSSGILCKQLDGSGVDPDYNVGILEADGSETFTPFSPARKMYSVGFPQDASRGPILSANRAWWVEGSGGLDSSYVVSVLLDGSDYRIDDDMTDAASDHEDYVFNGFHIRLT